MKSLPALSRVILTAVGTAVTKTVSRAEATRLQSAASALEAAGARVVGEVCARVQQPDDPKAAREKYWAAPEKIAVQRKETKT